MNVGIVSIDPKFLTVYLHFYFYFRAFIGCDSLPKMWSERDNIEASQS